MSDEPTSADGQWPDIGARLARAVSTGFGDRFPAAFALLAADARARYERLQDMHDGSPDSVALWHLVGRPAKPASPAWIREVLMQDRPTPEPADVAREMNELWAAEGHMTVDDPQGDLYADAAEMLSWHLSLIRSTPEVREYIRVAEEQLGRFEAPGVAPSSTPGKRT